MERNSYRNEVIEGEIIVFAEKSLYSKDAVFKCMYWYGDKFHVSVSEADSTAYRIVLKPNDTLQFESVDLELFRQKLERDLIDFNLRDIVTKETRNVRDLLIAKAFSNGEFEELPPGEVSDPVGFTTDILH